jgi:hypothetical protein
MTSYNHFRHSTLMICAAALMLGCGNETARSPSPEGFRWPDRFAYRFEYVSETQRGGQPLFRYDERRTIRFTVREDRFLVWQDSVIKVTTAPGRPATREPYWPEDTLQFYVKLGRLGELSNSEPGCDPALPACADALPSSLPLQLRPLIPRLPVWPAPARATWSDSLPFDDLPRSRGSRGYLVTTYRSAGDTLVGSRRYWVVRWASVRYAFRNGGGGLGIAGDPPVREEGVVFVDKERQVPVYSAWAGALAAPPELRSMGVTGTGFRGRAYVPGSAFDPGASSEP